MANLKLDDIFELALVSRQCWICFTDSPNLDSIAEARKLLDRLTDDLIIEDMEKP